MRQIAKYIVSNEHEFVYIIVQKAACTSVKTALLPLFDFGVSGSELVREDGTSRVHALFNDSIHLLDDKRTFLEELKSGRYEGHFKFAFVRNPYDRLLSCYLQKYAPGGRKDKLCLGGTSFTEFVEAVHSIPDEEANPHFRSQHVAVCDEDGTVIVDFVGRLENLEEDFAFVARRIGATGRLPHLTRSRDRDGRPYADFYDERLKRLVHERFEADLEIFSYSF